MFSLADISTSLWLALASMGAYVLGFVFLIVWGNKLGKSAAWIGVLISFAAAGLGLTALLSFENASALGWEWLSMGRKPLVLGIRVDLMAVQMLAMITGITFGVNLYSTVYMAHEGSQGRYFGFLSLFAFAMLIVVMAADLLLTFIGWELVGVASYFLIGFFHLKDDAARGSQKAFVINRIGDAGFVLALMGLFSQTGGFMLDPSTVTGISLPVLLLIGFGLMAAAFGKSAQFPLQTWLPDAMAGPTPVSSLIHAATMVAAGVYLMIRYSPFFLPIHLEVLAVVGVLTAVIAAISALTQTDIKRVLAYSTVSQLGFMMMGVGVGAGDFAFFHLMTHAFFKCGLFLSAGVVIHQLHEASHKAHVPVDAQDMRWMGGLGRKMPILMVLYLVFAASLAGLPLFSGFLSKDGLIMGAWEWAQQGGGWKSIIPITAIVVSALTAFYVARQAMLVFAGENRAEKQAGKQGLLDKMPNLSWRMLLPMMVLAGFSLWVIWSPSDPIHPHNQLVTVHSGGPAWLPMLLAGNAVLAILLSIFMYRRGPAVSNPNRWVFQLSFQHFFWDRIVHDMFAFTSLQIGKLADWVDRNVVDAAVNVVADLVVRPHGKPSISAGSAWFDRHVVDRLVNAAAEGTSGLGAKMRGLQSGKLQTYLLVSILLILLLVLLFYYFLKTT